MLLVIVGWIWLKPVSTYAISVLIGGFGEFGERKSREQRFLSTTYCLYENVLLFVWIQSWDRRYQTMAGRTPVGFGSYDEHGYSSYHAGAPPTGASSCKFYVEL